MKYFITKSKLSYALETAVIVTIANIVLPTTQPSIPKLMVVFVVSFVVIYLILSLSTRLWKRYKNRD